MKLTFHYLSIVLTAALGLVNSGYAQQPQYFPAPAGYQFHQPMTAPGYYPGSPGIVQAAMDVPLGADSSVMTSAPPAIGPSPSPPTYAYPAPSDCDGLGCVDEACASCDASSGLFGGGGILNRGNGGGSGLLGGNLRGRFWGDSEILLMWHKQRTLPVLATTSPQGTPDNLAGVLGQPTTSVLFGNQEISDDPVGGIRSTVGFWADDTQSLGFGFRYFVLENQDVAYALQSDGDPILTRPFFNLDPLVNGEDALLLAYPGVSRGNLRATSETGIDGIDAFARYKLFCGYGNRIDFIGGYQHTNVDDVIRIRHNIVSVDGFTHGPAGTRIRTLDHFAATNEFNGGEIGFMAQANDGRLTWSLLSKIAFGNMRQAYHIRGFTQTTIPNGGGSAGAQNGLLALPSNSGVYERDEFAYVPELNVKVAYDLTSSIQVSIGYNLIYWSDIVLANQAIDTTINPTQVTGGLVGPNAPVFQWPESHSFWTQGLSFGGSVRF